MQATFGLTTPGADPRPQSATPPGITVAENKGAFLGLKEEWPFRNGKSPLKQFPLQAALKPFRLLNGSLGKALYSD